jgi:hypothetical protein
VLALGDSFSSGEGLPADVTTENLPEFCHRSTAAWPELAASLVKTGEGSLDPGFQWAPEVQRQRDAATIPALPETELEFRACSGATVSATDYVNNPQPESKHFSGQFGSTRKSRYDIVLMSLGGNDSGFGKTIETCTISYGVPRAVAYFAQMPVLQIITSLQNPQCPVDWNGLEKTIDSVELSSMYESLASDRINTGGQLLVLTYPLLIADPSTWSSFNLGRCGVMSENDARQIRSLAARLNQRIIDAANEADGVNSVSVEVIRADLLFDGHELCGPKGEWLRGLRAAIDPVRACAGSKPEVFAHLGEGGISTIIPDPTAVFHPTCDGHQSIGVLAAEMFGANAGNPPPIGNSGSITGTNPGAPGDFCSTITNGLQSVLRDYGPTGVSAPTADASLEELLTGIDTTIEANEVFMDALDLLLEDIADAAPTEISDELAIISRDLNLRADGLSQNTELLLNYFTLLPVMTTVNEYTLAECGVILF